MRRLTRSLAVALAICAPPLGGVACGSGAQRSTTAPTPAGRTTTPAPAGSTTAPAPAGSSAAGGGHAATGASATPAAGVAKAGQGGQPGSPSAGPGSENAAFTRTVLPASTPIGSPRYHDAIVHAIEQASKSHKIGEFMADCLQKVLERAGIKTVGDAARIKRDPGADKPVANGALQCLGSSAGP